MNLNTAFGATEGFELFDSLGAGESGGKPHALQALREVYYDWATER